MLILSAAQAAHSQLVKGRETERDRLTERERERGGDMVKEREQPVLKFSSDLHSMNFDIILLSTIN